MGVLVWCVISSGLLLAVFVCDVGVMVVGVFMFVL